MTGKDSQEERPSLEIPSLGFGRRRRRPPPQEVEAPEPEPTPTSAPDPEPPAATEPPAPPPAPVGDGDGSRPRRFGWPRLGGQTAAVVTGAVVGALTVGLTWSSMRLCELVQGTSSCGTPGFFLLLAILVVMVLLGRLLLSAFRVRDPGSTSLLGMGLVAVLALLLLIDVLFEWWMVLIVPAVAMATFGLSSWVTATFVEPASSDDMHR